MMPLTSESHTGPGQVWPNLMCLIAVTSLAIQECLRLALDLWSENCNRPLLSGTSAEVMRIVKSSTWHGNVLRKDIRRSITRGRVLNVPTHCVIHEANAKRYIRIAYIIQNRNRRKLGVTEKVSKPRPLGLGNSRESATENNLKQSKPLVNLNLPQDAPFQSSYSSPRKQPLSSRPDPSSPPTRESQVRPLARQGR